MSNLLYLVIAVVLSLIGSLVLWARTRQPRSMDSGIEQFARELRALAPDSGVPDLRDRRRPGETGRERRSG